VNVGSQHEHRQEQQRTVSADAGLIVLASAGRR